MSNWKAALLIAVPIVLGACTGSAYGQFVNQTSGPDMSMPTTASPIVGTPTVSTAPVPIATAGSVAGAPAATAPLHISALNIAFDTDHLQAPANQPFVIDFANNDPGIPHNIDIVDANGKSVFVGTIVTGPTTVSYQVPALAPGSYAYHCDVHPMMTGTLTVN